MRVTVTLRLGDCLEVMSELDDCSVDAVVTDPPYGISFMGKHWDRFDIEQRVGKRDVSKLGTRLTGDADAPNRKETARTASAYANAAGEAGGYDFSLTGSRRFQETACEWATEWLRLLKPGGYVVVFGSTRMYHRLAAGIEDAGFEIRDTLAWMFGQGFPKSLDLAKAADKAEGHWRGRAGDVTSDNDAMGGANKERSEKGAPITAAGWGTALKPGYEPIVLARKPLEGTTLANFQKYGTGALNLGACGIPVVDRDAYERNASGDRGHAGTRDIDDETATDLRQGGRSARDERWPANVILDEQSGALLDEQSGEVGAQAPVTGNEPTKKRDGEAYTANAWGEFKGIDGPAPFYGDRGGASRFFYCAKVSSTERHAGCEPSLFAPDAPERNDHPTVKPLALMRWLIRLVTAEGAVVLEPFAGSGSTVCAAELEGRDCIAIEREPAYMEITRARHAYWAAQPIEDVAA